MNGLMGMTSLPGMPNAMPAFQNANLSADMGGSSTLNPMQLAMLLKMLGGLGGGGAQNTQGRMPSMSMPSMRMGGGGGAMEPFTPFASIQRPMGTQQRRGLMGG